MTGNTHSPWDIPANRPIINGDVPTAEGVVEARRVWRAIVRLTSRRGA